MQSVGHICSSHTSSFAHISSNGGSTSDPKRLPESKTGSLNHVPKCCPHALLPALGGSIRPQTRPHVPLGTQPHICHQWIPHQLGVPIAALLGRGGEGGHTIPETPIKGQLHSQCILWHRQADRQTDGQTDGRTDGQPDPSGRCAIGVNLPAPPPDPNKYLHFLPSRREDPILR